MRVNDLTSTRNWLTSYLEYDPFPARAMRKLVWVQESTLSSAAVAYQFGTENLYRLNDLFDTDQSGGSHQPYGYDTLASLYQRYVVHAVTIDIRVSQLVNQVSAYVAQAQSSPETFVTTGASVGQLDEQPNSHIEILDSQGRVAHIRKRFTIADLEGVTETQLRANLEEYGALTTATPTRTPRLRVAFSNMAGTTSIDCRTVVRFEFEAEFYDRKILAASS